MRGSATWSLQALTQAGISAAVGDIIDAHGAGRRRVAFHARRSQTRRAGSRLRGLAGASHRLHRSLPGAGAALDGAIPIAWALAEALGAMKKPLDIQVTATDSGLDVDVRGSGPMPPSRAARAACGWPRQHRLRAADAPRRAGRAARRADECAWARRSCRCRPARSCRPPTGEAALARLDARNARQGGKHVADLFCGVGPFALRLAETARVTAADTDAAAIASLNQAAQRVGPASRSPAAGARSVPPAVAAVELKGVDAVVFDPPRQGAEAQARELAEVEGAARDRGVVQRGDVRARCAHADRRRLPARGRDAGRSVHATRRMSEIVARFVR